MQTSQRLSLDQIQAFLDGSGEAGFKGQNREEVYDWVNQTLRQQRYEELKRSERGLVRRYMEKMTGLSRAQTTRLITVYMRGEEVKPQPYRRRRFPQRYTREDIGLLAGVDEAHETLSGPATKKLVQRACYNFHDTRYQSLARISVAHLLPTAGEPRVPRAAHQVSGDAADAGVHRGAEETGSAGAPRIPAHLFTALPLHSGRKDPNIESWGLRHHLHEVLMGNDAYSPPAGVE